MTAQEDLSRELTKADGEVPESTRQLVATIAKRYGDLRAEEAVTLLRKDSAVTVDLRQRVVRLEADVQEIRNACAIIGAGGKGWRETRRR